MAVPCKLVLFNFFYNWFFQSNLLSYSYIHDSFFSWYSRGSPQGIHLCSFDPCNIIRTEKKKSWLFFRFEVTAAWRKTSGFYKIWNGISSTVILSTQTAISDSGRQVATSGCQQWPWLRAAGKIRILSGITPPRGQWRTLQCWRIKATRTT